ncbi:MAG: hypothetical protein N3F03_04050 [Ignavibacteria bacterium]|nr:hypothetical protein [Ignavibacteria bacterium]
MEFILINCFSIACLERKILYEIFFNRRVRRGYRINRRDKNVGVGLASPAQYKTIFPAQASYFRHSCASRNLFFNALFWIPASAGMTLTTHCLSCGGMRLFSDVFLIHVCTGMTN